MAGRSGRTEWRVGLTRVVAGPLEANARAPNDLLCRTDLRVQAVLAVDGQRAVGAVVRFVRPIENDFQRVDRDAHFLLEERTEVVRGLLARVGGRRDLGTTLKNTSKFVDEEAIKPQGRRNRRQ